MHVATNQVEFSHTNCDITKGFKTTFFDTKSQREVGKTLEMKNKKQNKLRLKNDPLPYPMCFQQLFSLLEVFLSP